MPLSSGLDRFLRQKNNAFHDVTSQEVTITEEDIQELNSWTSFLSPVHFYWSNVFRAIAQRPPSLLIIKNALPFIIPSTLWNVIAESPLKQLIVEHCLEDDDAFIHMIKTSSLEKLTLMITSNQSASKALYEALMSSHLKCLIILSTSHSDYTEHFLTEEQKQNLTQIFSTNSAQESSETGLSHQVLEKKIVLLNSLSAVPESQFYQLLIANALHVIFLKTQESMMDRLEDDFQININTTMFQLPPSISSYANLLLSLCYSVIPTLGKRFVISDVEGFSAYADRWYEQYRMPLFELLSRSQSSRYLSLFQMHLDADDEKQLDEFFGIFGLSEKTAMRSGNIFFIWLQALKNDFDAAFFYQRLKKYMHEKCIVFSFNEQEIKGTPFVETLISSDELRQISAKVEHRSALTPKSMGTLNDLFKAVHQYEIQPIEAFRRENSNVVRQAANKPQYTIELSSESSISIAIEIQEMRKKKFFC